MQGELLPVVHEGSHRRRLRKDPGYYNPERVYAAEWKRVNRQFRNLLELLLSEEPNRRVVVSRRDAYVAATVIQWLGTNVGSGFVHECERKVAWLRENNPKTKKQRVALEEQIRRMRVSLVEDRLKHIAAQFPLVGELPERPTGVSE